MKKISLIKAGVIGQLDLKWRCLQAYCLVQLEKAEDEAKQGYGKKVFNEETETELREVLKEISERIRKNGNTHEILSILGKVNPRVSKYYNQIGKTAAKHFKALPKDKEEDFEEYGWIPSFLVFCILGEYNTRGHKGFEDINMFKCLDYYEKEIDKKTKLKHFECAVDVVETMDKLKFSFKKGKRC